MSDRPREAAGQLPARGDCNAGLVISLSRLGDALAYTVQEQGAQGLTFTRLRLLPTDGAPPTPVTPADQEVRAYRWSPAGDRLLTAGEGRQKESNGSKKKRLMTLS